MNKIDKELAMAVQAFQKKFIMEFINAALEEIKDDILDDPKEKT